MTLMSASIRATLDSQPNPIDLRKYLAPARNAMTAMVRHLPDVLG